MKLPADVQKSLEKQVPKVLKRDFESTFKNKFEELKNEMIKEFLTHPVTIEIKDGPSASNISGTLGGATNLFAFIGFNEGDDPITPILEILQNTKYRRTKENKGAQEFTVDLPQIKEIFSAAPMPWASGRSWAQGIEVGISGIGYLLRKNSPNSRSGAAIQSRTKVRGGKFQNVPYISAIIRKYEKKFSKLK
jgi:hypothetical protein